MNKTSDRRGQIFVLVEGDFEYENVLRNLCKCFPELDDLEKNVQIFRTNIYNLYNDIISEYSDEWEDQDINIPLLISRKKKIFIDRNDYTDIILVFDYERQDPYFDSEKILKLQRHFNNSTEDGKLYINYPMVESLYDMKEIPDAKYSEKKYFSIVSQGKVYKNEALNDSWLLKRFDYIENIKTILKKNAKGIKKENRIQLLDNILTIDTEGNVEEQVSQFVKSYSENEQVILTTMKAISTFVRKINIQDKEYNEYGSFWKYLREKIIIVAESNIRKIEKILTDKSPVDLGNLKDTYHNMDFLKLLIKQNEASCNGPEENRFIWVVNTFITILGEYKFFWKRNIESSMHNEGGVAK